MLIQRGDECLNQGTLVQGTLIESISPQIR